MKRSVPICASLLFAIASFHAHATSSIGYSGEPFSVHLVGGDFESGAGLLVEVSEPRGPRTLPSRSYQKISYTYRTSMRLRFDNPGDPTLPPSFTLAVCGNEATMTVQGRTHRGCFAWLDDGSDCLAETLSAPGVHKPAPDCAAGG